MILGAGGIVRKEKKIVEVFRSADATSWDRATTAALLGVNEGLAFRILLRQSILRRVDDGRLYLDEPAWQLHEAFRRRLAVTLVVAVFFIGTALYFWTASR